MENLIKSVIAATVIFAIIKIPWMKVRWFFSGLSTCCGEEVEEYSWKKAYCSKCKSRQ